MMPFDYQLPTQLFFGASRVDETGKIVAAYGRKPLIVTGKSSAKSGLLARVTAQLGDYAVFDGVVQNPLTTTVEEGLAILRQNGCDMVLGIGGGSPMDTAKAIAFMAKNDGDVNDYIMLRRMGSDALPVVLIPTTSGTGSEANCFAVLTNPKTNDKKSIKSPAIFPKASILDPALLLTQPPHVAASTGFDALSHNIEAYIANRAQPITKLLAAEGIRIAFTYLDRIQAYPADLDAYGQVMLASTYGGMAICMNGVGLPHAMEHPVSGLHNVVHGQGLAVLTPAIMRFNADKAPERVAELAVLLGFAGQDDEARAAANAFCDQLDALVKRLGLTFTLSALGVRPGDIAWLADNAAALMGANITNNPYVPDIAEVRALFERCM